MKSNPSTLTAEPNAPGRRASRSLAFTMIELLTVISIIGVLAALVVGGAGIAKSKMTEARLRADLDRLVTAIEDYKSKQGFYPPDNVVRRNPIEVNAVTNALYYELTGSVYDRAGKTFRPVRGAEVLSVPTIQRLFGVEGFVNAGEATKCELTQKPRNYLGEVKEEQFEIINAASQAKVLVLPRSLDWPKGKPDAPVPLVATSTGNRYINPWRYVSTNPTNNPTTFDLWAEFVIGGKVKIISNWNKQIVAKP